jgi:putative ATP-binding cassette transporter
VFESALEVTRRVVGAVARLTWITSAYGWFTIAAPISVASPGYLSGKMTFGQLIVAVGTFNQRANLSAMVCAFSRTGAPHGGV